LANGNTGGISVLNSSGTGVANIYQDGSGNGQLGLFTAAGSTAVFLNTAGSSYLTGGNVGIGTTSPGVLLDIVGGSIGMGTYSSSASSKYIGEWNGPTDYTGGLEIENTTLGGNYSQKLHLITHHFGATHGRRMTINEDGYVGIGTTSPEALLNVNGGIRSGTAATGYHGDFQQVSNDTIITANGDVDFRAGGTNDGSGNVVFKTALGTAVGGTNTNVERMRITAAGNVGIGTTSPNSAVQILSTANNWPYNGLFVENDTSGDTTLTLKNGSIGGRTFVLGTAGNLHSALETCLFSTAIG